MSEVIARYRLHPATVSPLRKFPRVSFSRHQYLRSQRRQFAEEQRRLWRVLKDSQLAVEFYRVVSWDGVIFDFFSPEARLGVCIGAAQSEQELSHHVLCVTVTPTEVVCSLKDVQECVQLHVTERAGVMPWPAHVRAVSYDVETKITTELVAA